MIHLEAGAAIAMTGRCSCVLQLQIVEIGLHRWDIDLIVAFAHNLGVGDDLGSLHWVSNISLLRNAVGRGLSLRFCRSLHNLTDFMSSICSLYALELLLLGSDSEIRA